MRISSLKSPFFLVIASCLLSLLTSQSVFGYAQSATPQPAHNASADELVYFTNLARTQYGLPPLSVNSALMQTAQQTADTMAANQLNWHIGGLSQRLMDAGYGGGVTVWATENIANGENIPAETIVYSFWNDDVHNIPVMNPIYCDIGAGVATDASGTSYYVLHAAYTEKRYCGEYRAPDGTTLETLYANSDTSAPAAGATAVSQWMQPVITVTPNEQGQLLHEVGYGQTLWSIAISYGTTIKAIQALNGYTADNQTVYAGQKLLVPTSLTPLPSLEPSPQATLTPALPAQTTNPTPITSPAVQRTSTQVSETSQEKAPVSFSTIFFWIALAGLLLILLGVLMKYMPGSS